MEAVREVIGTRATQRHMSEAAVVIQRKQFSCFNGITTNAAIAKASGHARWNLALELSATPAATTWTHGANAYCTTNIFPYWSAGKTPVATIIHHKFFKL